MPSQPSSAAASDPCAARPFPSSLTSPRAARSSTATTEARQALSDRQRRLSKQYRSDAEAAWVVDRAHCRAANGTGDGPLDPLHTWVEVGAGHGITVPVAVHRAVGGLGDLPVPGDLLAAALAACTDSTIRVVANALGVHLAALEVDVRAEVDVRGTLCVSPDVPVGFQRLCIRVRLRGAPDTEPERLERLVAAAEHCCVVLRTLRDGVPVTLEHTIDTPAA